MDKIRTAYTMALLPRATHPSQGHERAGMVIPSESFLSLSRGILAVVSGAGALWQGAAETGRRLRRRDYRPVKSCPGTARC